MASIKGGDKYEKAIKELAAKLKKAQKVKVGFLEDAKYPDGTSVALVASSNNFGTDKIPPRPFFSNMVATKQKGWPKVLSASLKSTGYDVPKTLDQVGFHIEGELKESIIETNEPPLAASTIRGKGFDKPLIDTSHMINSIDHEVE